MSQTFITVTGTYVNALGVHDTGRVTFEPFRAADAVLGNILTGAPIGVSLTSGAISVALIPTDDPNRLPLGWEYWVTEYIDGATPFSYALKVPIATVGGTFDLSTVVLSRCFSKDWR